MQDFQNLLRSTTARARDSSSGAYAEPNRVMSLRSPRAVANARPSDIPTSSAEARQKVGQRSFERENKTKTRIARGVTKRGGRAPVV
jgi:hypothetical protein